jgi:hypothetical protein
MENMNNGEHKDSESKNEELIDRIKKDNEELNATSGSVTDKENMGMSASSAVPGTPPPIRIKTNEQVKKEPSSTKNQLGDNPPGSEEAAFETGNFGDMNNEVVKYQAEDIAENFRENIEKTQAEIELSKKLKEDAE